MFGLLHSAKLQRHSLNSRRSGPIPNWQISVLYPTHFPVIFQLPMHFQVKPTRFGQITNFLANFARLLAKPLLTFQAHQTLSSASNCLVSAKPTFFRFFCYSFLSFYLLFWVSNVLLSAKFLDLAIIAIRNKCFMLLNFSMVVS